MILIKNNMKMIYKSKITYLILAVVIAIIICSAVKDVNSYYLIYQNDIFLWMVVILACITIHRRFVYSISYNMLVRINSKKKYIISNCLILLFSTIVICFIIYSIPCLVFLALNPNHKITCIEKIIFCFSRYILVSFFAQYVIYLMMLMLPKIQKNNNVIYLMPILLFFIVTLPKEFLNSNFQIYISALDFGSGGSILITKANLLFNIFFKNIHLMGYIICIILLSINILVYYMELIENGENSEP